MGKQVLFPNTICTTLSLSKEGQRLADTASVYNPDSSGQKSGQSRQEELSGQREKAMASRSRENIWGKLARIKQRETL